MQPRILLADDHRLVLAALVSLLAREFDVVATAESGEALLGLVPRFHPDVVVLDLNMPGISGTQALRLLVPAFPATRFLVLTMHTDLPHVREAFAAGAHGLVGKDASPADLIDAVWEVARGGRVGVVTAADQMPPTHAGSGALTARQLEIVRRVAVGMPGKQIADELGISPKTVEFHRSCIARQLGLRSTAALTRYALDRGLLPADVLPPAVPIPTDREPG